MKRKTLLKHASFIGCAAGLLLVSGCTHFFYGPTMHHTPLLQKKNEVSMNLALGSADQTESKSLNIAYAATSKLGIYGQYHQSNSGKGFYSGGNGTYADIAIGLFDTLSGKWRYEYMLGVGNARVLNNYGPDQFIENQFNKFYLQGNIGYRSKYFEACLAMRTGMIRQYGITPTDSLYMVSGPRSDYLELKENPNQLFIEPGLYISGGLKNWKLQLGYCSSRLFPFQSNASYNYQQAVISIGLKVNFTALK